MFWALGARIPVAATHLCLCLEDRTQYQALGRLHLSDCHVIFTRLESFFWVFFQPPKDIKQATGWSFPSPDLRLFIILYLQLFCWFETIQNRKWGENKEKRETGAILLIMGRFGISQVFMIPHAAFFVSYAAETASQGYGNVGLWGEISIQMVMKIGFKEGHLSY